MFHFTVNKLCTSSKNILHRNFFLYQNLVISQSRFNSQKSTTSPTIAQTSDSTSPTSATGRDEIFIQIEKPHELTEEEILAKRNKSGLRPHDHRVVLGEIPYPISKLWTHDTVKYQRKMYANLGEKSGIPAGLQWPDYEDIQLRIEYESVAEPFTFHEMVENVKEKRKLEKEELIRRAADIEAKMATLEKVKQEVIAKKTAKDREVQVAQERREKLMEEVRRHFGYKVDPREEKFQELLEKKEKEQRKMMKESRKQERDAKLLSQLLGKDKDKEKDKKKTTTTTTTKIENSSKKKEKEEDD